MPRPKIKKDHFRQTRGGNTKLLTIICSKCQQQLFTYQKDGPGTLKRVYLDRITEPLVTLEESIRCPKCAMLLGTKMVYERENRPAYRLYIGAVAKKSLL